MPHVQDEDLMRRFLLGEVGADERQRVEERFMTDAEYFEALCALEDEMVLSHVRGDLPPQWRRSFNAHILDSPDRRRRVEQTEELVSALRSSTWHMGVSKNLPKPARWPRQAGVWLAAAAGIVAVVMSGWLIRRLPGPDRKTSVSSETTRLESGAIATFVLAPGLTRSALGASNVFRVAPEIQQIRIELSEPLSTVRPLRAELRVVGGDPIPVPTEPAIGHNGNRVEISWTVPARLLSPGDYLLTLSTETATDEREALASRFFSVVD